MVLTGLIALGAGRPAHAADKTNPAPPTFEADIRPLFQTKCAKCHGEKVRKAGLDLTTAAGILKGGESGRAIVPGKPEESLLFDKVHSGAMPPKKEGRLDEAAVQTIRRWIAAGAKTTATAEADTVTQHDIGPIFLRRCAACHGRHRQEAGLDLRTRAAMLRGGKSGPAIVPGRPDDSLILRKIRSGAMPPKEHLVEASV